jgi:hypothetical protein
MFTGFIHYFLLGLGGSHHRMMQFLNIVTPAHCRPLENATISQMKSDNCKALQKKGLKR